MDDLFCCLMILILLGLQGCQTVPTDTPQVNLSQAAHDNMRLGFVYLKQNQPDIAYQKFLFACQQAPDQAEPWAALAYYHQSSHQMTQAKAMYDKAVKLAPGKGEILNNYGAFLCLQGNFAKARSLFQRALKDSSYVNQSKIYLNQVICDKMAKL